MDRITCVQTYVNRLLDTLADPTEHRTAAVHLYGVTGNAALLALRRGVDPVLASVCGLLHDISAYATGDSHNHAGPSAAMARSCLRGAGLFTDQEVDAVCSAIAHHSAKDKVHALLDEVLKDADVLHHVLHDPIKPAPDQYAARYEAILREIQ